MIPKTTAKAILKPGCIEDDQYVVEYFEIKAAPVDYMLIIKALLSCKCYDKLDTSRMKQLREILEEFQHEL